ncbi:MAG: hypothetical protein IPG76_09670 [Acidobacteria bacterium]|nr:hypothetical protein [Acidobacteriota bacterium]
MISDAIKLYNSMMNGPMAQNAVEKLIESTSRHNLYFGNRPLCTVLRPLFVSSGQYEIIRRDSGLILSAIEKLTRALVTETRLRSLLDLSMKEEEIISIDPGFRAPDASGRLDAFLNSEGGFSYVEYNADSPGGLLFGDVLSETFLQMEILGEFSRHYPLRRIPIRPRLLNTLLDCYQQWGHWNLREKPHIAIVDWKEVQTRPEFEICRAYFESMGYPTIITDPDSLEYRGGWLRSGNFKINLVYKRVLTTELLDRCELNHPLILATRDKAVCTVNSFRVQLLFKKSLFALLSDPDNHHLFNKEEQASIALHIPWSRKLGEGFTNYRGRRVDLIDFTTSHRENLVLKPNNDYGGRGVKLGWECSESEWQQAIKDALGASYIVQERVEVTRQLFPTMIDNTIEFSEKYVDFDPYTWNGEEIEGAGVRLSSSALLNVSAGGGSATPMFIIEE